MMDNDERMAFTKIVSEVIRFFDGDREAAQRWLLRPCPGLNHEKPNDVIKRGEYDRIYTLLTRLDHGVL